MLYSVYYLGNSYDATVSRQIWQQRSNINIAKTITLADCGTTKKSLLKKHASQMAWQLQAGAIFLA
jgi:hypothetical protein